MGFFRTHREPGVRRGARRHRPELTILEDRRLLSIGTVTATADPRVLAPADGRGVPVIISGTVTQVITSDLVGNRKVPPPARVLASIDSRNARQPAPKTALGQVNDQYHEVEPQARTPLHLVESHTFFNPSTRTSPTAVVGLVRNFSYSLPLGLQAKTGGQSDGRQYDITISAHDQDGSNGTTVAVFVPHGNSARRPRD